MDNHMTRNSACTPFSPIAVDSLSEGGQLFVEGVRRWACAARQRDCVKRALIPSYAQYDCAAAVDTLDELMRLIAVSAYRPVHVCALDATHLSEDEHTLLESLQALQRRQETVARDALSTMIAGGVTRLSGVLPELTWT